MHHQYQYLTIAKTLARLFQSSLSAEMDSSVRQAYLNPMRPENTVDDFVICDPVLGLTIGHMFTPD